LRTVSVTFDAGDMSTTEFENRTGVMVARLASVVEEKETCSAPKTPASMSANRISSGPSDVKRGGVVEATSRV